MNVLIVDDSLIVRERLAEALREIVPVAAMLGAGDVTGALLALQQFVPDLVILDLNLAGGSGLDLLPYLKRRVPAPHVVVLTNHAEPEYADRCRRLGADFFFDKSTQFDEALEAMRSIAG
jgi:DNA-binding NarL/FixJ family response regulator